MSVLITIKQRDTVVELCNRQMVTVALDSVASPCILAVSFFAVRPRLLSFTSTLTNTRDTRISLIIKPSSQSCTVLALSTVQLVGLFNVYYVYIERIACRLIYSSTAFASLTSA